MKKRLLSILLILCMVRMPHVCGDEPGAVPFPEPGGKYAPRMWG